MKPIIFLYFLILTSLTSLFAQDASFTAVIDHSPVAVGEQFQLSFTLNTNGKNFKAPPMNDFNVLSGPNQSSSMQFVNGNMTQSVTLSYILQAKREGTFKIGPATVETNAGKTLQSNPLTIKVEKGATTQQGGGRGNTNGGGQDNSQTLKQIGQNLFIKAIPNKTNVSVGEAIIVTYKLYSRVNLVNFSASKAPALTGFYAQDIDMTKQLTLHKETIDGITYNVGELKRVVVFPQYSGSLELDPMEGDCIVRMQSNKRKSTGDPFFDQFFNDPFFSGGAEDIKYTAKSSPIKITVKTLPGNAPASFSGAVGKFSLEATIDKITVKENDPVTLKMKVTGNGNLKLIDAEKFKFPNDFEAYDPKTSDKITTTESGVSGSRTFEYLLIPRHAGEYKLPPISFSYFDPDKKQYITLNAPDFKLKIEKGNGQTSSSSSVIANVNKEDVAVIGKDIRFIKTNDLTLNRKGPLFVGSGLFYTLYAAPLILFLLFLGYYSKNKELNSNLALVKSRKANKIAQKRLSVASNYLKQSMRNEFYDEVYKVLWGYVSDRLTIPTSQLTKETAIEHLHKKGIIVETTNQFIDILNGCEFARFAPGGNAEMEALYNKTVSVITEIEQNIK